MATLEEVRKTLRAKVYQERTFLSKDPGAISPVMEAEARGQIEALTFALWQLSEVEAA